MHHIDKKYILAEIVLVIGVFTSLLSIVTNSCIWFDEGFSINLINNSFSDIISYTALDVHPPLYYIVLKVVSIVFNNNFLAYYIPSFLCFLGLIVISFVFFAKHFSQETGLLVSVALCTAPNIWDSVLEIRMYTMAILFVTASFYVVYLLGKDVVENANVKFSKYWVLLSIMNVLAAYTHYFAGVAAAAISCFALVYLLVKSSLKESVLVNWGFHCILMILLYLPWMPVLFKQMSSVGNGYWIPRITEAELHAYPNVLFSVSTDLYHDLLVAAYVLGFFVFLLHFRKDLKNMWLAGCYIVILIWFGFGIGYSVLRTPIMTSRYMAIILPLFWIPICISFSKKEIGKYSAFLLVLFVLVFSDNYEKQYAKYSSMGQEGIINEIRNVLAEEDALFYTDIKNMCVQKALIPNAKVYALEGCDEEEVFHYWPEMTGCIMVESAEEMDDVKGNIWLLDEGYIGFFEKEGWKSEVFEGQYCRLYRVYR